MILDHIQTVEDLRNLGIDELEQLSGEVREYIIDVISRNGGHLASSLGVVELTIALHCVFNTPEDKLIWDVGHQCYTHKILTGRKDEFKTIRKFGGISGFPKQSESSCDTYDTGHSSTSLSLALGTAVARDIRQEKNRVIAVIGDGSLTGGMAFEALNNIGHTDTDLIIILNDNEHSISKNVGALSKYLTRIITDKYYNKFRRKSMELIKRIPKIGPVIFRLLINVFGGFKGMLVQGRLFDDMGIRYFGPVDGHNLPLMIEILKKVRDINFGPKIIHVITKKGKGYQPAETDPARFHGIGPFDKATGIAVKRSSRISYSDIAGRTLAHLAGADKEIIAITAAMKLGTGLYEFEKKWPERFFDVGIAEQHAITFAAALASQGFKPFVSVYSTFLQRAVDQLIHDVAMMNLPVRLLIDRSGLVGDDGETHHGVFDISIIKSIPNFVFLAPSSGSELMDMIHYASQYNDGPIAIRYPRGTDDVQKLSIGKYRPFKPGRIRRLTHGRDVAIFAAGDMTGIALQAGVHLKERGISTSVMNLLSIKPLDLKGIERIIVETRHFITLENGVVHGGIGESIAAEIQNRLKDRLLFCGGLPDQFISHGTVDDLLALHGMDPVSIARRISSSLKKKKAV